MDPINKRWYRSKLALVIFHILAWLLLFSLPLFTHREPDQGLNWRAVFNVRSFVFDSSCVAFFYLNSLFLIPRFLNRKKIGIYVILLIGLFVVFLNLLNLVPMEGRKREFQREFSFLHFSPICFFGQ